jgi:hypothetical protein
MSKNNVTILVIVLLLSAQLPLLVVTFGNNNDHVITLAHAKKSLSPLYSITAQQHQQHQQQQQNVAQSSSYHIMRTRGETKIPLPSSLSL